MGNIESGANHVELLASKRAQIVGQPVDQCVERLARVEDRSRDLASLRVGLVGRRFEPDLLPETVRAPCAVYDAENKPGGAEQLRNGP